MKRACAEKFKVGRTDCIKRRCRELAQSIPSAGEAAGGAPGEQESLRHYNPAMLSEASQILASVASAYAACRSYRDEGVVETTFFDARKRTDRQPFSTRFVRPGGFFFEFRSRRGEDDWDQYAIWNEGGKTRTWWSVRPEREGTKTLGLAIAWATGVSGGAAHRVPHLLMPQLGHRRASESARVIAVPQAAAEKCVVVEIPQFGGGVEQIWIDESSFLIRKVVEPRHALEASPRVAIDALKTREPAMAAEMEKYFAERPVETFEVESVTMYRPEVDVEIAGEELVFVPPME